MQPVMVEQHLDRLCEVGIFKPFEAALWEEVDGEEGSARLRKKVDASDVIKKRYTVANGKRCIFVFTGGWLTCLLAGDQVELNGTGNGNGTGLSFIINSAPDAQPFRRVDTSFRSVDKIYADMSTVKRA